MRVSTVSTSVPSKVEDDCPRVGQLGETGQRRPLMKTNKTTTRDGHGRQDQGEHNVVAAAGRLTVVWCRRHEGRDGEGVRAPLDARIVCGDRRPAHRVLARRERGQLDRHHRCVGIADPAAGHLVAARVAHDEAARRRIQLLARRLPSACRASPRGCPRRPDRTSADRHGRRRLPVKAKAATPASIRRPADGILMGRMLIERPDLPGSVTGARQAKLRHT